MSGTGAGTGGTPDEDDVWRKFLMDSEEAIRVSAPREPSAREREPGRTASAVARPDGPAGPGAMAGGVGEPWQPDEPLPWPAWRDLDGPARLRRVARGLGAAAAVVLALTGWSQLTAGPGTPSGGPGDTVVERVEDAPAELPTAGPSGAVPSGAASASASASATS
ncbi:hypothetical protein AB0E75_06615 [Streptomyces griseoviridis]|uniref:Uncharacterized protein n=1 Tax=Streptomyces griseoviridis TaxID=45398 RepID=A0A918GAZ0_STRGD|nr:hypothetical protein [Streptomyces niveoruber]GGS27408.1 hypothetical protein GCM10010238_15180 [Streptomyces niveoruber]